MIVWQRLLAVGQLDATILEIDADDLRTHDAGAMQAAAQRRGNVRRLQATGGHFGVWAASSGRRTTFSAPQMGRPKAAVVIAASAAAPASRVGSGKANA